ncbi:M48 family metallopeptidase [Idiomarina sp. ST10R2A5]|uniref:M48 family metallopeptidase n=1 Tax=Idiomarina sp. ST10R2A5 TaxID=3418368 RepID=UPI003EC70E74
MSEQTSANEIVIGRRHIPYRLVKSAQANKLKLQMTMDEFQVTAPEQATLADVQLALKKKHKWIIENYAALQDLYEKTHKVARFRTGAKLPYWGRLAKLHTQLADVQSPVVSYKNGLYVSHPNYATSEEHDDKIEIAIHDFLKDRFSTETAKLVRKYSELLGITATSVRVKAMSKRWGSCTLAGCVSLDWRLVYAPKRVGAYVVAHELAHLKIHDHSDKFWNLLQRVYGDFKQEHKWLEKNEHLLGYKRINLR